MNTLNSQEIQYIREGGKIWQKIKQELLSFVKPGVSGKEVNDKVELLFQKYNLKPAFNQYKDFPGVICVSVNDCIIHGVGNETKLKPSDKITLDIGFEYKGIYIDSAFTLIVDPPTNPEYSKFISDCEKTLWEGIKGVKPYCCTGDITAKIESFVTNKLPKSYSILDGFVGHGIGRELHQKPNIPNKGLKSNEGVVLLPNQAICIEPMILEQPTGEFKIGENGFDIFSKIENVKVCHCEHMVLIKEDGIEVLTASPEEIEEYLE